MNASPPSASFRRSLSPAARAMRLQRVFARMQEGAAYAEIAAEENISRERLGQIIRRATLRQSQDDEPSHRQMQVARLTPAFRLAAAGVAKGDVKSIPLLLQLVDRLDRYSDRRKSSNRPAIEEIAAGRKFVAARAPNRETGRLPRSPRQEVRPRQERRGRPQRRGPNAIRACGRPTR